MNISFSPDAVSSDRQCLLVWQDAFDYVHMTIDIEDNLRTLIYEEEVLAWVMIDLCEVSVVQDNIEHLYTLHSSNEDNVYLQRKDSHDEMEELLTGNILDMGQHFSKSSFRPMPLRPGELEILNCISQGMTTEEISIKLHKSKRTVSGRRTRLIQRSGTKNTAELVSWAFRQGYIR